MFGIQQIEIMLCVISHAAPNNSLDRSGNSKASHVRGRLVGRAAFRPLNSGVRRLDQEYLMILIFQRTGQRRYAIQATRPRLPDVVMSPAAGYDPLMPHDLMHLVVEAQLGLDGGVFGQLAAGGNAGTFHPISDGDASARAAARVRHRMNRRGTKLMREGR